MQKRISKELSKTFPECREKYGVDYTVAINSMTYETVYNYQESCPTFTNYIDSLTLTSKSMDCSVILTFKPEYPFKPPSITNYIINLNNLNNQNNPRLPDSYLYWCSRLLTHKTNYDIFISHVFTSILMPIINIPYNSYPDNKTCLCCESLICSYKWSPAHNIFTIFNECVYRRNIKRFLHPVYRRYFHLIFKNESWDIPDDIILTIIQHVQSLY